MGCSREKTANYLFSFPLSYTFKSLRHCVSAGEPINPEVMEEWKTHTGLDIHEGYGQTETVCSALQMFKCMCPGFGQDRVNFHQNPGKGTAGWADPTPTWPNRAGYSIPCAVTLGSGAGGTHSRLGRAQQQFGPREWVCSAGCFVYSPFLYRCCSCSLCRSVKLPLSRPTGFCLFLSILLRTAAGGGAAAWRFCYWLQPKPEQYALQIQQ